MMKKFWILIYFLIVLSSCWIDNWNNINTSDNYSEKTIIVSEWLEQNISEDRKKSNIDWELNKNDDFTLSKNDILRESLARNISDGLSLYKMMNPLPLPEDLIEIKENEKVISYKGKVWKNILKQIEFSDEGIDINTGEYIDYILTSDRKNYLIEICLGSELLSLWKKSYFQDDKEIIINYWDSHLVCK